MPTYEYECQSCQHVFDAFQGIREAPLTVCPECGGPVKRMIGTGAGILFKGSGFYCTDFKNPGARSAAVSSEAKPAAAPKPQGDSAPSATPPACGGSCGGCPAK